MNTCGEDNTTSFLLMNGVAEYQLNIFLRNRNVHFAMNTAERALLVYSSRKEDFFCGWFSIYVRYFSTNGIFYFWIELLTYFHFTSYIRLLHTTRILRQTEYIFCVSHLSSPSLLGAVLSRRWAYSESWSANNLITTYCSFWVSSKRRVT